MKTSILKTSLALAISAIALCSFTNKNATDPPASVNSANHMEEEEWTKVYNFINTKICSEIRKAAPKKNVKTMNFSRCPSGINSEIENEETVSSNELVYGTIQDYDGCGRKYVCDFKVCVNKQMAMVKGKNETEYVTVQDWLKRKKQPAYAKATADKKIKG